MQEETKMTVNLSNPLFNRLHTLAVEYTTPTDMLVNLALKRLIDDIDFMRELRAGIIKLE
jgi:hypothetical protein